jgi:hypothetical protein
MIVAALLVGVLTGASAAAEAAAPRWQTVPVTKADDHAVVLAAGRVWVMNNNTAGGDRFVTKSARISNGKLSSWVTATLEGFSGWSTTGLLGGPLVFIAAQPGTPIPKIWGVTLRPNGTLGKPAELRGAPAPPSSAGSGVIQLPDRAVTFADPHYGTEIDPPHLGMCCDVNGEIADYHSFIPPRSGPIPTLGLDRRGRLWLAWKPSRGRNAQIVELDRKTLQPLGKPLVAPALSVFSIVDLACTDVCRLIMEGASRSSAARNFSWAPGERSPTPIRPPGKDPGTVIGARADGGQLALAYSAGSTDQGSFAVSVARGDKRGGHLRLVSSIAIPPTIGSFANGENLTIGPVGTFGPGGFAAVAVYEQFTGGNKVLVRVAILPLR